MIKKTYKTLKDEKNLNKFCSKVSVQGDIKIQSKSE